MPVLKPTSFVEFDVNNPEHVASVMEVQLTGRRSNQLKFNSPAPFTSGITYAMHLMAMRYGELMREHPEKFQFEETDSTTMANDQGVDVRADDNIRRIPVIGAKSHAPQPIFARVLSEETTPITRSLLPGTAIG